MLMRHLARCPFVVRAHNVPYVKLGAPVFRQITMTNAWPPPQPPKSHRLKMWLIIGGGVVLAIVVTVTKKDHTTSTSSPPARKTHVIRYRTEGTARYGSITYATPAGTAQESDVDVPLKTTSGDIGKTYTMRSGAFAYLSIQNGTETGSVICVIEVDGIVAAKNTSNGAFSIATCSGRVP